eukprot:scaffold6134_cov56-Cylindrotheca_fusiformis.AAC.1
MLYSFSLICRRHSCCPPLLDRSKRLTGGVQSPQRGVPKRGDVVPVVATISLRLCESLLQQNGRAMARCRLLDTTGDSNEQPLNASWKNNVGIEVGSTSGEAKNTKLLLPCWRRSGSANVSTFQ